MEEYFMFISDSLLYQFYSYQDCLALIQRGQFHSLASLKAPEAGNPPVHARPVRNLGNRKQGTFLGKSSPTW